MSLRAGRHQRDITISLISQMREQRPSEATGLADISHGKDSKAGATSKTVLFSATL